MYHLLKYISIALLHIVCGACYYVLPLLINSLTLVTNMGWVLLLRYNIFLFQASPQKYVSKSGTSVHRKEDR